jgi:parallel beta-helix repeat protein
MKKTSKRQSADDPRTLWVAPSGAGKGRGTIDDPYVDLNRAVEKVLPGYTIMLKKGEYHGDCTIQKSGLIDMPIRILPETGAEVTIVGASWYLYDASDMIVEGICFRDSPLSGLSVIGACERNRFANLSFVNCGGREEMACSLFFGGDGALCNLVENCAFEAPPRSANPKALSIGLMISEGDIADRGALNKNHIFRNNTFVNFGCAIAIGSRGHTSELFGHRLENNQIRNSWGDGIRVRCGDTLVQGNIISNSGKNAISLTAGGSSTIIGNRIEDSLTGIRVLGTGHTIQNNCIIGCTREAVHVCASADENEVTATNILIEQNSCVDCGGSDGLSATVVSGVRCDPKTTAVIQRNLFSGPGTPYEIEAKPIRGRATKKAGPVTVAEQNIALNGCLPVRGCNPAEIAFVSAEAGNFETISEYGAHGWFVSGNSIPKERATVIDWIPDDEEEVLEQEPVNEEEFVEDIDATEYFFKSGFYGDQQFEEDELV